MVAYHLAQQASWVAVVAGPLEQQASTVVVVVVTDKLVDVISQQQQIRD